MLARTAPRKVARAHDHGGAAAEIGRHRAERDRKGVEVAAREQVTPQHRHVHQGVDFGSHQRAPWMVNRRSPCSHATSGCSTPSERGA